MYMYMYAQCTCTCMYSVYIHVWVCVGAYMYMYIPVLLYVYMYVCMQSVAYKIHILTVSDCTFCAACLAPVLLSRRQRSILRLLLCSWRHALLSSSKISLYFSIVLSICEQLTHSMFLSMPQSEHYLFSPSVAHSLSPSLPLSLSLSLSRVCVCVCMCVETRG